MTGSSSFVSAASSAASGGRFDDSRIVTRTEDGFPAVTGAGRSPIATVNVSSSVSASSAVVIVPLPLVKPALTRMPASVPWSPSSDLFRVTVKGTVKSSDSASDSRAVIVTASPSSTGFGEADSDTAGFGVSLSNVIV